jgi:predicted amidohydrolase
LIQRGLPGVSCKPENGVASMKITLVQMDVGRDLVGNTNKILSVLQSAQRGEWIAFPEGALTGYFPEEPDFLGRNNQEAVERAIQDIAQAVKQAQCHCLFGTALFADNVWYNAVVFQSYAGEQRLYRKIQLSALDKRHFTPGNDIPVFAADGITTGIQVCREILFPDAWSGLKQRGAQVVFHINNALKPYDDVWKHLVIARAVENRMFVCSVNNAAPPQKLTSYLVAPTGRILLEADEQAEQTLSFEVDLSEGQLEIY